MVQITHRTTCLCGQIDRTLGCQMAKNFVKIADKIELIIPSQWECWSNSNVLSDVAIKKRVTVKCHIAILKGVMAIIYSFSQLIRSKVDVDVETFHNFF